MNSNNMLALGAVWACLLLVIASPGSQAFKSKCPATRDLEMDSCASRMGFLGDHSFRVPKSPSAMNNFCVQLKDNIGCLQTYSRDCLQGFTKQILNSLLKRGKQQHTSLCQTDAVKTEFTQKMSCLTDDKIDQFHQCMDASIARFEYISKQVVAENRLPALCCSYQIFFRDVEETLGLICNRGGANFNEVLKYIQKIVTGATGELIHLVCDNHRTMDECRTSGKTRDVLKQLELITKQAKQNKIKTKSKSLIPPLLEILDTRSTQ